MHLLSSKFEPVKLQCFKANTTHSVHILNTTAITNSNGLLLYNLNINLTQLNLKQMINRPFDYLIKIQFVRRYRNEKHFVYKIPFFDCNKNVWLDQSDMFTKTLFERWAQSKKCGLSIAFQLGNYYLKWQKKEQWTLSGNAFIDLFNRVSRRFSS